MQKVNELAEEFGYDYRYEPNDLINIFQDRIERQLRDLDHEQYIDCSYISICSFFPELIPKTTNYINIINRQLWNKKQVKS